MDTFDNNEFVSETENSRPEPQTSMPEEAAAVPEEPPAPQYTPETEVPQPEAAAYRGAGEGRKESPYVNSPYVMNQPRQEQYSYTPPQQEYQPQYEAPQKPKKAKKGNFWKRTGAAVLALAVVAGGCLITASSVNSYWEERNEQTVSLLNQKIESLQDQLDALARQAGGNSLSGSPVSSTGLTPGQVYAKNVDSVVAVSSTVQAASIYGVTQGTSTGSGFILTEDGFVVTNCHVVEGATAVSVVMHNGLEYDAQIVGTDSTNDIAVLKIDADNLPAAAVGSSDDLVIGDMVVAIGNPLGELTSTQTVGYVSGKDRDVTTDNTIINMIQTDAAINSGNSGGPLFNMNGEVVGITTAKYSGTTGSGASIEGIGFAIPIDDVKGIISDLMEHGYVTGAYLGVIVSDTDAASAAMFGLPVGAYVQSVESGAAADRAGILPKDIIIDLGGHEVEGITTLTRALRNFKAGDTTTVTVVRSGQRMTLDITLDEKPHDNTASEETQETTPGDIYGGWYDRFFGGNG
ncbi:MAG: trypsin-like peptidase domain-containing protein [Oscillospiraceae bacterium]|nr:trypsin-like peptidase domain-containing protein [Oscillospiraceae bacterium]